MEIKLKNIHKYYGPVHANREINITIHSHSIHGILGENGAGKSTLMKILAGFTSRSKGQIFINGKEVDYRSPAEATSLGIGMLYQDPQDFPSMTVLDNFILGLNSSWHINRHHYKTLFEKTAGELGFKINPETPVSGLTVGERQQLEIIRLLAIGVEVLILDEPTTGISSEQKGVLFKALKRLARSGKSIIIVSHKLEDIEVLCHRVTILREGRVAGEMEAPFDTSKLLTLMFGSRPPAQTPSCFKTGSTFMALENVSASGGRSGLHDCSLEVRQGEIVGLAGLEGSGQEVFLRLAAGLVSPAKGRIILNDKDITGKNHAFLRKQGICFLPSSRLEEGLFADLSLAEHYAIAFHKNSFFVPWNLVHQTSSQLIKHFRIKGTANDKASALSGGNQQRLLLSLIPSSTKLLLLEQPTRGLDMESALWVWDHLKKYCKNKTALIFSSAELDEIFSVADRIVVFFNGRIVLNASLNEVTLEEVTKAIAGKG
nr:ATP-binding cassette domain-containing protein [Desulfovulcanus ferrireducens]